METDITADPGRDWPRHCEACGSELQTAHVRMPADDNVDTPDLPVVRDFCPNPECPRHDADLAARGGVVGGVSDTVSGDARGAGTDDRPGSLGGDHGGG